MHAIYTIGYGNRQIDLFLSLLQANGIRVLVDTRSKPFSRFNPAYRQKEFEQHLNKAGIDYLFLGDKLGGKPEDWSLYTSDKVDYHKVRHSAAYQKGINELIALSQKRITCILCSELNPDHCHRKLLITPDLVKEGIPVFHIDGKGNVVAHEEKPHQGKLF
jgi:uncharacterized protein (DUF488 family)